MADAVEMSRPIHQTNASPGRRLSASWVLDALSDNWRMVPVSLALVAIWLYFWWANPLFLSPRNLSNLSLQIVVTGVVALGLLFVLVIGEIDLSVAAGGAVSAAIAAALAVNHGLSTSAAVAVGLLVGAAIGVVQGAIVTIFRAPAFIVTLGSSLVLQGLLLDLLPADTNLISLVGQPMGELGTTYLPVWLSFATAGVGLCIYTALLLQTFFARRRLRLVVSLARTVILPASAVAALCLIAILVFNSYRGVPLVVALFLGLLAGCAYVTTQTRFGLHLYAIGANAEAARRAGIPVSRIKLSAFILTGIFAALGGLLAAGRVLGVSPDSADSTLLLEAIAAAVIGGVSLFGGRGSVWAALLGALVIGSVSNGMLLVDATTQTRLEVQGAILVLAVVVDALLSRRAAAHRR